MHVTEALVLTLEMDTRRGLDKKKGTRVEEGGQHMHDGYCEPVGDMLVGWKGS